MIVVCALLGAANGVYLTMDTSLAVDTLDVDEDEPQLVSVPTNIDFDEEVKAVMLNQQGRQKKEIENHNDNHGAAQLLGVWGVFGFIGSALGPLIGGTALIILGKIAVHGNATNYSNAGGGTMLGSNLDSNGDGDEGSTTAVNVIFPSSPFYKFQGYEALFSLSAFYFFCSALSLAFVRKEGV